MHRTYSGGRAIPHYPIARSCAAVLFVVGAILTVYSLLGAAIALGWFLLALFLGLLALALS